MAVVNLQADVKNLVAGLGLKLASTQNSVNLSIDNSGLAEILSEILRSNSSVSVNYSSQNGTITFTSTANVTQGQLAALLANTLQSTGTVDVNYDAVNNQISLGVTSVPPPDRLIITNKNQFDANGEIAVALNQDVLLIANNDANWDNNQYYLVYPTGFSEVHSSIIVTDIALTNVLPHFSVKNAPGSNDPPIRYYNSESLLFYVVGTHNKLGVFGPLNRLFNN